jgi:ABC-type dipeptide/oligopeptide/nickel transport system ATPase component
MNERPSPLLQINDLAVSFETGTVVRAVDGVSLSVHGGQTLAVVGESGSGKSVTALSVLRLLPSPPARYERGSVAFDGRDLLTLSQREMRRIRGAKIAMIFQEPMTSLNPVFAVGEQIQEAIQLHRRVSARQSRKLAVESMEAVGIQRAALRLRDYPHEFSGGMRQRVMIAMALACEPKLLLADEPTTALDVTIQAQILELLGRIKRERGMGIMLITHDLGIVAQHAEVVCVMYAGRVVEYAKVFDLFENPLHPYTRALLACRPRLDQRAERLTTVAQVVDNPLEFKRLADSGPRSRRGIEPWWPTNPPPTGVTRGPQRVTSSLHEVEPEHWVACWRTEAVALMPGRKPDVAFGKVGAAQAGAGKHSIVR